ncbi:MAG: hypothetical protein ACW991_04175, partial [Candidatus Hodarchaeales archaeon]
MGNEEFKQNQYSDQQKELDPSESNDSGSSSTVNDHTKEIQKLQDQVQQLQDQLAVYRTESQEREKKLEKELVE